MLKTAVSIVALVLSASAFAQATPVGLWKTIDDDTKKEKSLVRITDTGGLLTGKIEKFLEPASKPDAVCDKCSDERKDKAIVGMAIVHTATDEAHEPAARTG